MKSIYIEKLAASRFDLELVIAKHLTLQMGIGYSAPWHKQGRSLSSIIELIVERTTSQPGSENFVLDERHDTYSKLTEEIDATRESFFSPALHLNHYLDWMIEMGTDELEITIPSAFRSARGPSLYLQNVLGSTYATSILVSIKSALDKLVRILHFYYPGIASHTTWGRCEKNGKNTGFMAVVEKGKASDELLLYLEEAYSRWIYLAVAPRDALVHYKGSKGSWSFLKGEGLLIREHSVQQADGSIVKYGVDTLCEFVNEWYDLAEVVLEKLASREPLTRKKSK